MGSYYTYRKNPDLADFCGFSWFHFRCLGRLTNLTEKPLAMLVLYCSHGTNKSMWVKPHQLSFFNPPVVCSVNPSSMVAYGATKPISWNILVWFFPIKSRNQNQLGMTLKTMDMHITILMFILHHLGHLGHLGSEYTQTKGFSIQQAKKTAESCRIPCPSFLSLMSTRRMPRLVLEPLRFQDLTGPWPLSRIATQGPQEHPIEAWRRPDPKLPLCSMGFNGFLMVFCWCFGTYFKAKSGIVPRGCW